MRKRRQTVFVRPGKDVTLYIPVDTPEAVIDYLNHLKEEGMFSQGVIDILAEHIQGQPMSAGRSRYHTGESAVSLEPADSQTCDAVDPPLEPSGARQSSLDLAQIFRQAQRNAGKLTDSGENK